MYLIVTCSHIHLGENVECHLSSLIKGLADEKLFWEDIARVEAMQPQYDDPLRSMLEGIGDKRYFEATSLRKVLDESNIYAPQDILKGETLRAHEFVKEERFTPPQVDL